MLRLSDLRDKEIININDGQRLGYPVDFDIDVEKGLLTGMIIPGEAKIMSLFSKGNDIYVNWDRIIKIGVDTILVNLRNE